MKVSRALYSREVLFERLGIQVSNTTLIRWERDGRFPRRVRLAHTSVAWRVDEIEAWLQSCADARAHQNYADYS